MSKDREKTPLGRNKFIHTYLTPGTQTHANGHGHMHARTHSVDLLEALYTPFVMLPFSTFNFSNVKFSTAICRMCVRARALDSDCDYDCVLRKY